MSVNSFIPQIWHAGLLRELENVHVFSSLTNKNYEQDSKNAGSVIINQISNPSVSTYSDASGITFEDIQTSSQTLNLDQEKYWAYRLKNLDKIQSKDGGALMQQAMQGAAYAVNDTLDAAIAAKYSDAGIKEGSGGGALGTSSVPINITADGSGTSTKVVDWLSALARRMGEANVPGSQEKTVVVPYWLEQKMVKAKILDARGIDNNGTYANGKISTAYGFTLKSSNNVSNNGTNYRVMAGNTNCITLAMQLDRIKAGERDEYFEDYIAGYVVYGLKTIRADQLLCSIVTEGTEGA